LLQHKAFMQHIKDIGGSNLMLTKIIEKRKDSYTSLKHSNRYQKA
jgi:hypothetical protein